MKTAGQWGADIFVGEGQPFGTPLAFGGPFLGLFACTDEQTRRLPGRIVGETVDSNGRRSFVTTLRAREQDIRREKATSNVCTNQTLMAVTAAIQLGWLGTQGLREIATRCAQGAHYLFDELVADRRRHCGLRRSRSSASSRVRLGRDAPACCSPWPSDGVLGGVAVARIDVRADPSIEGDLDDVLLVTVTERRTKEEIDRYVEVLRKAVGQ